MKKSIEVFNCNEIQFIILFFSRSSFFVSYLRNLCLPCCVTVNFSQQYIELVTGNPIIHPKFMFLSGGRSRFSFSLFSFLHMDAQFPSTLLERLPCPHWTISVLWPCRVAVFLDSPPQTPRGALSLRPHQHTCLWSEGRQPDHVSHPPPFSFSALC